LKRLAAQLRSCRDGGLMLTAPMTLEGRFIRLLPLSLSHHEQLCAIGLEPALWQHTTIRVQTPDEMRRYIDNALES
jgi:N-acetyltransferase